MTKVRFYSVVLDDFLNNPSGDVGDFLDKKGKDILALS
jgi:hypothetical protein